MKTPKKSLAALLAMTLTVGLTACSGETDSQSAQSASSQPAQSASSSHTQEESGFPFTLTTKDGQEVTFTHVPETIISCNPNAGDELMALGLGDKIIATAYNNTQVNPQWREEYEAIPTVAESYISLETILSLEPTAAPALSARRTTPPTTPSAATASCPCPPSKATPWGPTWTWSTRTSMIWAASSR